MSHKHELPHAAKIEKHDDTKSANVVPGDSKEQDGKKSKKKQKGGLGNLANTLEELKKRLQESGDVKDLETTNMRGDSLLKAALTKSTVEPTKNTAKWPAKRASKRAPGRSKDRGGPKKVLHPKILTRVCPKSKRPVERATRKRCRI